MASPSFDDLYNIGKAELQALKPELFVNEGDVTDVILNAAAAMADKCIQESIKNLRKTFLNSAEGDDLTTLVQDHYGINRTDATAAVGTVTFTRSAGPLSAGSIPTGTVLGTDFNTNGERFEYTTDGPVVWADTETGSKDVNITASATGPESNASIGAVSNIVSNIFDSNITVTNADRIAGGNNEETDAELRERARNFPATLRRGTLAALEFGAKQVDTVVNATATEDTLTGDVDLYVSDADGNSNAQMVADVTTEIEEWRCAGTDVTITGGAVTSQDITVDWSSVSTVVRSGFDPAAVEAEVESALINAAKKLKIGETLFKSVILGAIKNVDPDNILEVDVPTPATNVAPATANEVIRVGTVTFVY